MAGNAWFAQFLADTLGVAVEVPASNEATALGTGVLAAVGCGAIAGIGDFASVRNEGDRREPSGESGERQARLARWHRALGQALVADG